jgi:FMN reductase (NADPH)
MNDTIQTMQNHRSIRKFKNIPLTQEQIDLIVQSAQMAPTSFHSQPFTIIGITDPDLKKKLAEQSGNWDAISQCGYFFVFCLDLYRIMATARPEEKEKMKRNLSSSVFFAQSTLSAGIALQNANLAAESMGLGTVIIGGINRALPDLDEWLDLPEYVIPLAGLAVGVPNENPEQKPRLPQDAVFFENQYDQHLKEKVKRYDQETEEYYRNRTDNKKTTNWSQKMIDQLSQDLPLGFYSQYLKQKGFHFHSPGCRNHPASLFSK